MFRSNIFLLCAFCAHVHAQEVEFVVMDCDEGWELDEYFFSFLRSYLQSSDFSDITNWPTPGELANKEVRNNQTFKKN